jgi:dihydrofolate reductase
MRSADRTRRLSCRSKTSWRPPGRLRIIQTTSAGVDWLMGRVPEQAINVLPKYVPSTTLTHPTWQNTHVMDGDVEAAVSELKAKPGRELQVHGSGALLRWLLERDLVDELNLRIYPVIVGDGLRLFPEHGQTHNLELVESRSTASGVMLQTYQPAGRATFGNAGE